MPGPLQRALERLERALAEQQHPVVRGLLPGVSETQVRRMLAMAELDTPDDLVTWFGWHNGYAPPPGEPFAGRIGPTLQPLGLEFAYDAYTELRYDIGELAPDEDTEWFPVVTFTHSGMILMYCGTDAERGERLPAGSRNSQADFIGRRLSPSLSSGGRNCSSSVLGAVTQWMG